ncbi:MAG: UDP-glucose 6-dehydrogenase [Acidimicrobiia bacterium]|nr:MAG: UDP-glucose 6-dehydrogenase [Acidimicrobiia bacterium]
MNISIVGTGYVGLVTGSCLAELGHTVTCIDVDVDKVNELNAGEVRIFETGLTELVRENMDAGRLRFTADYSTSIPGSAVVFIAVGTPSADTGEADLSYVDSAIMSVVPLLDDGATVVIKSTVPVGTTSRVESMLPETASIASNPEFLKQGAAVADFLSPDRIVVGTQTTRAEEALRMVYKPLLDQGAAGVFTDIATAELIKYSSNAFLAIKLSFINEMADLCEQTGASISDVATGMGLDSRISKSFLNAGPGYGGSCFPKDTQALLHSSHVHGASSRIVASAIDVNRNRRGQMIGRITRILGGSVAGKDIAILGLTFKADTDDLRESPAIEIVRGLLGLGANVRVYDPQGMDNARSELRGPVFATDAFDAMKGADAVVIVTEWPEFGSLDLARVHDTLSSPTMIDLRNLYNATDVTNAGIEYHSIGRKPGIPAGRG